MIDTGVVMKSLALSIVAVTTFLMSCHSPTPDPRSPEGAFAGLIRCLNNEDTTCLFWRLDEKTRWSLSSIHKHLSVARRAVDSDYPDDMSAKRAALGKWWEGSNAKTTVELFDIYCRQHQCLNTLKSNFAAIRTVHLDSDERVRIDTVRDTSFVMGPAGNGKWGLADYRETFVSQQIRVADMATEIEKNAHAYREQRLATSDEKKDDKR